MKSSFLWLKVLGFWIVSLAIIPAIQVGYAYFADQHSALELSAEQQRALQDAGFSQKPTKFSQQLLYRACVKPDYFWSMRRISEALAPALPIAEEFRFHDFWNRLADLCNIVFRCGLVIVGIGVFRARAWSRTGYMIIASTMSIFAFFPSMLPFGAVVSSLGVQTVIIVIGQWLIFWITPVGLLLFHPSINMQFSTHRGR